MAKPYKLILRGKNQPETSGITFENDDPRALVQEVLDYDAPDAYDVMIQSPEPKRIAFLDGDLLSGYSPVGDQPLHLVLAGRVVGAPFFWVTHGGGIRAVCFDDHNFPADEIAAMLAVVIHNSKYSTQWRALKWEIVSTSRHPRYPSSNEKHEGRAAGEVQKWHAAFDPRRWYETLVRGDAPEGHLDQSAVEAWLEERCMQMHGRYPHTKCPIDPSTIHGSDPVIVGDEGIYCYRCAAHHGNGFRSWDLLVREGCDPGLRIPSPLRQAVNGPGHWEHVQHVITNRELIPFEIAKKAYRALVRVRHLSDMPQDDPEVEKWLDSLFWKGKGLVRVGGQWVEPRDMATPIKGDGLHGWLAELPACQRPVLKGRKAPPGTGPEGAEKDTSAAKLEVVIEPNRHNYNLLRTTASQAESCGYPNLYPVRGVDLACLMMDRDELARVPRPVLPASPPFRYMSATTYPREPAWQHLAEQFPGVNPCLVKLVLFAAAYAQLGGGHQPPMILITGVSGAAKTATVHLALALMDQRPGEIGAEQFKDDQRLLQAYASLSARHDVVLINEFTKLRKTEDAIVNFLLRATSGISYHKLYAGTDTVEKPAAIILTDVAVPDRFAADEQLARRIIHVDLGAGRMLDAQPADWRNCNSGDIRTWRGYILDVNLRTANAIVSEVCDDLPPYPARPFAELSREVTGFRLIRDADSDVDRWAPHRALFQVICDLSARTDRKRHSRWPHSSWYVFEADNLCQRLRSVLTDTITGHNLAIAANWQAFTSAPWVQVLGIAGVELDLSTHGRNVALRFRQGPERGVNTKYNAEIQAS